MAACVLSLLVLAPTMASAGCDCEGEPASAAHQTIQAADHAEDDAPCKAACCLGGHCHHAGSALDAPVAAIAAPLPADAEHMAPAPPLLTSHTPAQPAPPPRA